MAEIAGLKLIVPSSVSGSGVSVSASGKVTVTAASTIEVDGCFTSLYENYLVIARGIFSQAANCDFRLRASGVADSASNYYRQYIEANGTSVQGARQGPSTRWSNGFTFDNTLPSGNHLFVYGPYLTQPTAATLFNAGGYLGGYMLDSAFFHTASTSYDGFQAVATNGTFTGALTIYGLSQ